MDTEQILAEAKAMEPELIRHRRYLHQHPGTGFDLKETVEYVKKCLRHINTPCPLNLEGVGAFLFPENIA